MRSGLLSLTLLGTAARGCFLRGAANNSPHSGVGPVPDSVRDLMLLGEVKDASPAALSLVRERRIHGKRALTTACSGEPKFDQCHRDSGSALKLEKCLHLQQIKVSKECSDGLQSWKELLAETSPTAQRALKKLEATTRQAKKSSPLQRAAANRYNVAQQVKKISGGDGSAGGRKKSATSLQERAAQRQAEKFEAAMDRQAKKKMAHAAIRHERHSGDHSAVALPMMSGEIEFLGEDAVIWVEEDEMPFMEGLLAGLVDGNRRGSEGGHPGHPPHHHKGRIGASPPGYKGFKRSGMGHHGGPRFTGEHAGPRHQQQRQEATRPYIYETIFDEMDVDHRQQRQAPRPSMFSVLVDWITGDSSSSDSAEDWFSSSSDSSSDDLDVDILDGPFFGGSSATGGIPEPQAGVIIDGPFIGGIPVPEREWMNAGDSRMMEKQDRRRHGPPPPHGHGPFHGAPQERGSHGGRDHIRSRNRLPEDLENRGRAFLADSLDGEDMDPVEGILAFFFFVGACTLLLLPFFLLGRALKKLVRAAAAAAAAAGGGSGDAPDGYQALPDDATTAAAAAAAAAGRRGEDDDNVVVTGTPVNPPPSVHL